MPKIKSLLRHFMFSKASPHRSSQALFQHQVLISTTIGFFTSLDTMLFSPFRPRKFLQSYKLVRMDFFIWHWLLIKSEFRQSLTNSTLWNLVLTAVIARCMRRAEGSSPELKLTAQEFIYLKAQ